MEEPRHRSDVRSAPAVSVAGGASDPTAAADTPFTVARACELAAELTQLLTPPIGFRDSARAGMMLVFIAKGEVPRTVQDAFVAQAIERLSALDVVGRRRVAHGLCEVRQCLYERQPGVRTLTAMSLWESLVAKMPLELQYLAREGEIT